MTGVKFPMFAFGFQRLTRSVNTVHIARPAAVNAFHGKAMPNGLVKQKLASDSSPARP